VTFTHPNALEEKRTSRRPQHRDDGVKARKRAKKAQAAAQRAAQVEAQRALEAEAKKDLQDPK
jgi:hypothetical protein